MHEPYTYLNGLTTTDLEDLLEDIKVNHQDKKKQNSLGYYLYRTNYQGNSIIKCRDEVQGQKS